MKTNKNNTLPLIPFILCVGIAAGCTSSQTHQSPPEGTWVCRAEWSCTHAGAAAQCAVEQHTTCADNMMSVRGVLFIGDAQWFEKKSGSCHAAGAELFGTWTAVQTDPPNDAARQFERKTLAGKGLAAMAKQVEQDYRVRVTSRAETEVKAVNAEGRLVACTRS